MQKLGFLCFLALSMISSTMQADLAKEIEAKINMLTKEIENLKYDVLKAEDTVEFFNLQDNEGIEKINTNAGPLYIKTSNVLPEGDGYKVKVFIGNPLNAEFGEISLGVAWKSSKEWQRKKFAVEKKLPSSSWISTDVVLSPMESADALKAVLMTLKVGTIELKNGSNE